MADNTRKSLNKVFLKQKPLRSEIELFKTNRNRMLNKVDEFEREENQRNHFSDFTRDTGNWRVFDVSSPALPVLLLFH